MGFGYEGRKTRLVPVDRTAHLDHAFRWINDPEISEWLAVGDMPMSRSEEEKWLEDCSTSNPTRVHFAIETLEGVHIGFSGLFRIDQRSGTAMSGSMIGDRSYWGLGMGSDAARVRARYAFEILNLRMLYSSYLAGNERSRHMQESAGYLTWGVQPDGIWKRGGYRDIVSTYLSRDRFRELEERSKG